MICYKCHQAGHRATECPNIISFTREDYDEQIKAVEESLREEKWRQAMTETAPKGSTFPPEPIRNTNPFRSRKMQKATAEKAKQTEESEKDFLDG